MQLWKALTDWPVGRLYSIEVPTIAIAGFNQDIEAPESFTSTVKVTEAQSSKIVSVQGSATVKDAIDAMTTNQISALVVTEGKRRGIVTPRDIFRRRNLKLDQPIWDLTTHNLDSVPIGMPIGYLVYMMFHNGYRHVLLDVDDAPWRVVSANDLLRYIVATFPSEPFLSEKLQRVVTFESRKALADFAISPDATMERFSEVASRNNAGALLVKDEAGELLGIISEKDYMHSLQLQKSTDAHVRDFMTPKEQLVIVEGEATLKEAMEKMLGANIRHLVMHVPGEGYRIIGVKRFLGRIADELPHLANLPDTPRAALGYSSSCGGSGGEG